MDASELAVAQAEKNAALNGLADRVHFRCADVFDLLPALEREGEQFDLVILDPPAFTKSRSSVKNAQKGYREINLRAMHLVRDKGYLATCSCCLLYTSIDRAFLRSRSGWCTHWAVLLKIKLYCYFPIRRCSPSCRENNTRFIFRVGSRRPPDAGQTTHKIEVSGPAEYRLYLLGAMERGRTSLGIAQ